jgi:hypothetical protein
MDIHEYHLSEKNAELDIFIRDEGFFQAQVQMLSLVCLSLTCRMISLATGAHVELAPMGPIIPTSGCDVSGDNASMLPIAFTCSSLTHKCHATLLNLDCITCSS